MSLHVGWNPEEFHWDAGADAVMTIVPYLLEHPRGTVINLNVPNAAENRGFKEAALAPFGIVQTTMTEQDEHHVRLAVEDLPNTPAEGTDAAHLAEGWITLTGLEPVSQAPLRPLRGTG